MNDFGRESGQGDGERGEPRRGSAPSKENPLPTSGGTTAAEFADFLKREISSDAVRIVFWEGVEDADPAFPGLNQAIYANLLMGWWWDDEDKVYRNDETGEVMDEETMIALRDQIADWQVDYFAKWPIDEEEEPPKDKDDHNILALLLLGIIALDVWERKMRQAVQDSAVIQYAFGRGGFDRMTDADWAFLEGFLLEQYGFLSDFAEKIASGTLSEALIAWEAGLYFDAALSVFEQGRMKAQHAELNLTRHPGDFTSECLMNDRCYWSYTRTEDTIECKWVRTVDESCPTCISRESCPRVIFVIATGEHINMECYEQADAI